MEVIIHRNSKIYSNMAKLSRVERSVLDYLILCIGRDLVVYMRDLTACEMYTMSARGTIIKVLSKLVSAGFISRVETGVFKLNEELIGVIDED